MGEAILLWAAWACLPWCAAPPGESSWESRTLANGVRAAVIVAPGAERQILFTFVPHGLTADSEGRVQWAHLLEHLAIRSTDPLGLQAPGLEFNGETSADAMRLDAYAEPARFEDAVQRQVAWLTEWRTLARADPEVLEREKGRIAMELENTVRGGYAHKWADAAWAQAVFHGLSHAAVAGAIQEATVAELQEWRDAHPTAFRGILTVTVGPRDPEEVWAALEEGFGSLDVQQGWRTPAPIPGDPGRGPDGLPATSAVAREATWDLPATHVIDAFFVPGDRPEHRLSAVLLAQALQREAFQDMDLRSQGVNLTAGVGALVSQGTWIRLSANVPVGVAVETVQQAMDEAIQPFANGQRNLPLGMQALQYLTSLARAPDFAAARRQAEARGIPPAYLEGNLVLPTVITEWQAGADRLALSALRDRVEGKALAALAAEYLRPERRERLVLRPAPDHRP